MTTTRTSNKSRKGTRPDIYQSVTDQIIEALEAGASADQWQAPWHAGASFGLPENASSHKAYRGVNVFLLWAAQQQQAYPTHLWATYKQWKQLGAQVRKGETATTIWLWKPTVRTVENDAGEREERQSLFARSYSVFNAAQVDGYDVPDVEARPDFEVIDDAQTFFAALGADVAHGGNAAYYLPASDRIQLPEPETFRDNIAYYATSAHEHVHWTGHAQRADRDLTGRFGTQSYAAEELVAEIGAAYVCAHLGLTNEARPDHAQYVASWLKLLRDDPKAIITAASKAQQAVDWLVGHADVSAAPVAVAA